jgi:hypothetical protein
VATRNNSTRGTPETQTLDQPIMSHHFEGQNTLWDELAEEAAHYLELIKALKHLPANHPDRDILETALYGSIAHLEVHSQVMNETIRLELEDKE